MDIQEKRKLAHEYALASIANIRGSGFVAEKGSIQDAIAKDAWAMADAMEAQELERKPKGLPEVLRSEGVIIRQGGVYFDQANFSYYKIENGKFYKNENPINDDWVEVDSLPDVRLLRDDT